MLCSFMDTKPPKRLTDAKLLLFYLMDKLLLIFCFVHKEKSALSNKGCPCLWQSGLFYKLLGLMAFYVKTRVFFSSDLCLFLFRLVPVFQKSLYVLSYFA